MAGGPGRCVDAEFWRGRRVLITGHSGFKGTWLTLWLSQLGAHVTGLAPGVPTAPSLHFITDAGRDAEHVRGDVRDLELVCGVLEQHRPEVVVHLAAQPLVGASLRDPRRTYEVNVMGAATLLEAVRQVGGVRAMVVVTSDRCYENRGWEWPYREYEDKGGADPYSSSKACVELLTDAYRRSFFAGRSGAPRVATARTGNLIGGGDWSADRLVPDLMRAALTGRSARVRDPRALRSWQHVLDPLHGYLLLAEGLWESEALARAWNFGPPPTDARPVGWMVEHLAGLWPGLSWEADGAVPPLPPPVVKLDSAQARAHLGWAPRWELSEALGRTVEWYRGYHEQADLRELTLGQIRAYATPGGR